MYLLDTNIISELKKIQNNRINPNVLNWFNHQNPQKFYTSSIVIMELKIGALLRQKKDETAYQNLMNWIDYTVIPAFNGQILPIDDAVLAVCANLHVPNPRGQHDALIGATAISCNMTVVTRNVSDFDGMSVNGAILPIINPFNPTTF